VGGMARSVRIPALLVADQPDRARGYELKLEIDTRVTPMPQVIGRILQTAPVADIAVQDPPLEAVIARIYQRAKGGST